MGRVKSCAEKNGKIIGVVVGEREYISRVSISPENLIKNTSCSCPLSGNCKHVIALLLRYIEQTKNKPNTLETANTASSEIGNLSVIETELVAPSSHLLNQLNNRGTKLPGFSDASPQLKQALFRLANAALNEDGNEELNPRNEQSKAQPKAKIGYVLHDNVFNLSPSISAVRISLLKDGTCSGKTQQIPIDKMFSHNSQYVSSDDMDIAQLYCTLKGDSYYSYYTSRAKLHSDPDLLKLFLQRILATGRTYLPDNYDRPLALGEAIPGRLEWAENEKGEQYLCAVAESDGNTYPCLRWSIPWYIDKQNYVCGPVKFELNQKFLEEALRLHPVGQADADCMQFILPSMGLASVLPTPKSKRKLEKRVADPVPTLKLGKVQTSNPKAKTTSQIPALVLTNHYEQPIDVPFMEDGKLVSLLRNRSEELENVEAIRSLGFSEFFPSNLPLGLKSDARYFSSESPRAWMKFLAQLTQFRRCGWNIPDDIVEQIKPIEASADEVDIEVKEENSWWFSLRLNVEIDGKKLPLLPIVVSAIRSLPSSKTYNFASLDELNINGRFVALLDNCRLLSLPFERIKPILISVHELLLKYKMFSPDAGGEMKLSFEDAAALLQEDAKSAAQWRGADTLFELRNRFQKLADDSKPTISKKLKATLRSYQKDGLSWLQKLAKQKFGGILADDMGLGKTMQLLAFLAAAADAGELDKRPFLVVCPKSVLPNWLNECARFVPNLKVLPLHGKHRNENLAKVKESQIIVSTYPVLARDINILEQIDWFGVALDESQAIKNSNTNVAKAACKLRAEFRFCLTGTPIENNLLELWSQFNFLLPDFLGDKSDFKRLFQMPIEKNNDLERKSFLSRRVKPFILRRTKDEVATDLPEKSTFIQHVEIEGGQLDLYETMRNVMAKKVRDEIKKKGFQKSQIIVLDALLKLRQVCCDPRLVKMSAAEKIKESSKLDMLMEMLEELQKESRKVLVFSQFRSMLELIKVELVKREIAYVELTGATEDRETPVRKFQTTDVPVFLLSLKAGGTGLNLTAADVVIHYDPWWNPAVEDQATDRAHRIGQTKKVFVYKLVVKGSIEERMLQLQERKKALASSIYDEAGSTGRILDEGDIEMLLGPIDSLV